MSLVPFDVFSIVAMVTMLLAFIVLTLVNGLTPPPRLRVPFLESLLFLLCIVCFVEAGEVNFVGVLPLPEALRSPLDGSARFM